MKNKIDIASSITMTECIAVGGLYDRIFSSMKRNKIKRDQNIWDSLEAYFKSREPKFKYTSTEVVAPGDWERIK